MRRVLLFFAFYAAFLLRSRAAGDFPLAIGGHGTVFYNGTNTPLTNARIWVQVLTAQRWTNASFTNATEVRVDSSGNYELEAIVGDAACRVWIRGIRLYLESHIECIKKVLCWHREVDLEYMYLYKPGRKPSRQFKFDIMLIGPPPHGEAMGLIPGITNDECFHASLAVNLLGRISCNASVPAVNATVFIVANRTSDGPLATKPKPETIDSQGAYEGTVIFDAETRPTEIQNMLLVFTNTCDGMKPPTNVSACTIPLDFMYAYEEGFRAHPFRFQIQVDTNEQLCDSLRR